jgi:hypothetical protein
MDNLIVSWEQSIWLCCVQVPHCSWQSKALDEAPYKFSRAVASYQASPSVVLLLPLRVNKPWFLTEGKSCCYIHHTFLLGFPTGQCFSLSARSFREEIITE